MPWTSSVESVAKEGITATPLAKTSEFGQSIQGYYNLTPDSPIPDAELQAYTVALALDGKFKSFYADKEIPPVATASAETENGEIPVPTPNEEAQTTKTEGEQTQIVVVGTAQFLAQLRPRWHQLFLKHCRLADTWRCPHRHPVTCYHRPAAP